MNLRAAIRTFEGPPPAFLVKGAWVTSAGGPVELRRAIEASPSPCVPSPADVAALKADLDRLNARLVEAREGKGNSALALTIQLRRLMLRHGVRLVDPPPLDLLPPIEAERIRFRGVAATSAIDLDRTMFRADCWPRLDASNIKLCVSHNIDRVAGSLDTIEVSAGRLVVTGTITDKAAMRLPGLSVSALVEKYTILNPDDRYVFCGEIEKVGAINEISLTQIPGNRNCLVTERWPVSAIETSYDDMIGRIRKLQGMVAALKAA